MTTLVNIWNTTANVDKGIKWDNNTLFGADFIIAEGERVHNDSGKYTFCRKTS